MATFKVLKALRPGLPVVAFNLGCENATYASFVSRYVDFIAASVCILTVFSWTVYSRKKVVIKKITV